MGSKVGQVYFSGLPDGAVECDIEQHFGAIGILKKDKRTRKPMVSKKSRGGNVDIAVNRLSVDLRVNKELKAL